MRRVLCWHECVLRKPRGVLLGRGRWMYMVCRRGLHVAPLAAVEGRRGLPSGVITVLHFTQKPEVTMSFMLVIVPLPNQNSTQEQQNWGAFYAFAKVENLKEAPGVFYLNDRAWIFDTQKSLHLYGLVLQQAHERGVQVHTFPLDDERVRSRVASSPRSAALEDFLAS